MLRVMFKSFFYLHCHTQHNLYLGSHVLLRYSLTVGSATKSHILTMMKTRWMPNDGAISVTTQPRQGEGKSNTPLTYAKGEVTIATPPMVKTCRITNDGAISGHIASNILRICLRCHIAKIKQMCTNVVEGYRKFMNKGTASFCPRMSSTKFSFSTIIVSNASVPNCS
jgi:hypothetical protein